jgi:hypothetical protein
MSIAAPASSAFASEKPQSFQYRSLSVPAVVCLVLGVVSSTAFLFRDLWLVELIPLSGLLAGAVALRRFRTRPDAYVGRGFAFFGMAIAALCFAGSVGLAAYDYATEVPEGYDRITYDTLQPEAGAPETAIPDAALALDGQKVFIKGYAYQPAGGQQFGIKQFMLVRDKGDCCFGGNPKLTDMILVTLRGPLELEWSLRVQKLGGIFRVQAGPSVDDLGTCVYHLDADYMAE